MNYDIKAQLLAEGFKHEQLEEVNSMENKNMINEGEKFDKFKKKAKRTALGVAAAGALAAAPGIKCGFENVKNQNQAREFDKAGAAYNEQKRQQDLNDLALQLHKKGLDTKEDLDKLYKAGKIKADEYSKLVKQFAKEKLVKEEVKYFNY